MADFFYATITYPSGDTVRLVHKGREPTKATMRFLGRIGALFTIGEPVPAEVAHDAELAVLAITGRGTLTANAQFDTPEPDDD